METVKIYLCGGMSDLSLDEQLKWRRNIQNAIKFGDFDLSKKPIFFNPPDYYSPSTDNHKSEREAMEYDLNNLRKSDLVIVNFNIPKSIGSAMELMLAKELHIPVVGLNKNNYKLHPWLTECCIRICDTMDELINHVQSHYLN